MQKIIGLLIVLVFLSACAAPNAPAAQVSAPTATVEIAAAADTPAPLPTSTPPPAEPTQPPAEPTQPPAPTMTEPPPVPTSAPALAADPQEIAFTAADGQALSGLFYPAARPNAPVVVLIHWVRGDQADWYEVAAWLQNRGLQNPFPNPATAPWWDPAWFVALPENASYNVFIFSLRGCQPFPTGCAGFDPPGWLADSQGAVLQAAQLEGVDPARIVTIGASIGADAAADVCAWLNEQTPGACRGALSLSPGNYLGIAYKDPVKQLSQADPPAPVWCLANPDEIGTCREAGEYPTYRAVEIPAGGHGTMLLSPGLDPLPLQLIVDFLKQTTGE